MNTKSCLILHFKAYPVFSKAGLYFYDALKVSFVDFSLFSADMNHHIYPLSGQPMAAQTFYGMYHGSQPGILGPPPAPFPFWGSVNAFQPSPFSNFSYPPPVCPLSSPGHSTTRMPGSADSRYMKNMSSSTTILPPAASKPSDLSLSSQSPGHTNKSTGIRVPIVQSPSTHQEATGLSSSYQPCSNNIVYICDRSDGKKEKEECKFCC